MNVSFSENQIWISTETESEYYLMKKFLEITTNPKFKVEEDSDASEYLAVYLNFE